MYSGIIEIGLFSNLENNIEKKYYYCYFFLRVDEINYMKIDMNNLFFENGNLYIEELTKRIKLYFSHSLKTTALNLLCNKKTKKAAKTYMDTIIKIKDSFNDKIDDNQNAFLTVIDDKIDKSLYCVESKDLCFINSFSLSYSKRSSKNTKELSEYVKSYRVKLLKEENYKRIVFISHDNISSLEKITELLHIEKGVFNKLIKNDFEIGCESLIAKGKENVYLEVSLLNDKSYVLTNKGIYLKHSNKKKEIDNEQKKKFHMYKNSKREKKSNEDNYIYEFDETKLWKQVQVFLNDIIGIDSVKRIILNSSIFNSSINEKYLHNKQLMCYNSYNESKINDCIDKLSNFSNCTVFCVIKKENNKHAIKLKTELESKSIKYLTSEKELTNSNTDDQNELITKLSEYAKNNTKEFLSDDNNSKDELFRQRILALVSLGEFDLINVKTPDFSKNNIVYGVNTFCFEISLKEEKKNGNLFNYFLMGNINEAVRDPKFNICSLTFLGIFNKNNKANQDEAYVILKLSFFGLMNNGEKDKYFEVYKGEFPTFMTDDDFFDCDFLSHDKFNELYRNYIDNKKGMSVQCFSSAYDVVDGKSKGISDFHKDTVICKGEKIEKAFIMNFHKMPIDDIKKLFVKDKANKDSNEEKPYAGVKTIFYRIASAIILVGNVTNVACTGGIKIPLGRSFKDIGEFILLLCTNKNTKEIKQAIDVKISQKDSAKQVVEHLKQDKYFNDLVNSYMCYVFIMTKKAADNIAWADSLSIKFKLVNGHKEVDMKDKKNILKEIIFDKNGEDQKIAEELYENSMFIKILQ